MSKVWFTSDNHFGHFNVIQYSSRPFESLEEMNREMVRRWNEVVGPRDLVYHVGDFAFLNKDKSKDIFKKLNGEVVLVKGNHDAAEKAMKEIGFKEVHQTLTLDIAGEKVLVCHYPFAPKKDAPPTEYRLKYMNLRPEDQGQWLIHGHVHNYWKFSNKMINVSVENWNYTPVSLETIEKLIKDNPRGFNGTVKI